MIYIHLRAKDGSIKGTAVVDDQDAYLADYRWHMDSYGYAIRHQPLGNGRRKTVLMHRQVMGVTDPAQRLDHDDRDKLNNRRYNLKHATHAENMMNVGSNRNSTSRYRGVSWNKKLKKWTASFRGKYIGTYEDESTAAAAAAAVRGRE